MRGGKGAGEESVTGKSVRGEKHNRKMCKGEKHEEEQCECFHETHLIEARQDHYFGQDPLGLGKDQHLPNLPASVLRAGFGKGKSNLLFLLGWGSAPFPKKPCAGLFELIRSPASTPKKFK